MISKHSIRAEIPVEPYWAGDTWLYRSNFTDPSEVLAWATGGYGVGSAGEFVITPYPGNTSTYAQRAVPGMVVGERYAATVVLYAAADEGSGRVTVRVGDSGTTDPNPLGYGSGSAEPIVLEFVCEDPAGELLIDVTDKSTAVHIVSVTVQHQTRHRAVQLDVQSASPGLDEKWSPYAQATLVCKTPEPEALTRIDPRDDRRVRLTLEQRFGESATVAAFSALHLVDNAFDISMAYGSQPAAALSAEFGQPYNAFGMRPSTRRTMDLALRSRDVDTVPGTMTLELASDEALAQDAGLVSLSSISPAGTNLVAAVELALSRIGAHLSEALDVPDLDPAALVWEPGVSAWDYVAPLVQAGERRLWCDEHRVWRLSDPAQPASGGLSITGTLKQLGDRIDRDADWYDAVVIEFRWTDSLGAQKVRYDVAGPETASRVMHLVWERPFARAGAAAAILRRSQTRARSVDVTAVSDYTATPGDSLTVTTSDGTVQVAVASSVAWQIPGDDMALTTRDLLTAPAHSWLADPPEVAWTDVPVGIDWTEDE